MKCQQLYEGLDLSLSPEVKITYDQYITDSNLLVLTEEKFDLSELERFHGQAEIQDRKQGHIRIITILYQNLCYTQSIFLEP